MSDVKYQVIHSRRITTLAGACHVYDHNLRKNLAQSSSTVSSDESVSVPDYLDSQYMQFNSFIGCQSRAEFCTEYLERLEKAQLERKPQKNASRIVETIISSSHSFCEDWKSNEDSRLRVKAYLEDAVAWERERHGDVALSIAYHWDEKTPHVHLLSIPLVTYLKKDTNEMGHKFSSSEFFGSKGDLIQMHTDFHEKVGRKYGLERGQYGSRATHKELRDYKTWEREQRQKLMDRELHLAEEIGKAKEVRQLNSEVAKKLSNREEEILKREYKVGFDAKVLDIKKRDFEKMAARVNQGIPHISEPPIGLNRSKVKRWVESMQDQVTKTFQALKAAYESMGVMYSKAIMEIKNLRTVNKQLHDENMQIKHDLLHKPLSDIQAQREALAAQNTSLGRIDVEPDVKKRGRIR